MSQHDLVRMWFEPWLVADERWFSDTHSPAWCQAARQRGPQAMRLGYFPWCFHHQLPSAPPAWLLTTGSYPSLPDRQDELVRATALLGAVSWFRHPPAEADWLQHRPSLNSGDEVLPMLGVEQLRAACRLARLFEMPVLTPWTVTHFDSQDCLRQGVSCLRLACESDWKGLWSRWRFRFAPELALEVESSRPEAHDPIGGQRSQAIWSVWQQALRGW